ncbi:MAG TPA: sulfotransferase domain-containing protein [Blastocatellia bacterium]|nr:sulfotransferase domain-containing protein [Blastocatellia bacterium]
MLPNFIGIGAAKAGTTWLFRCLQEHPEIYVAPVKETKFFDDEQIEGRGAEYEAHFAGALGAKAVGEISVRYLASRRDAARRIQQWIPNVRLFVSLRNPIDQVWSHYWHLRRQNFHQDRASSIPATVEDGIHRYPELLLEPALYGKHLRHWLEFFDREQLHVILYDEIAARPDLVIRDLYAFLTVDPGFRPASLSVSDASVRRGASPRSAWLGAAHRKLYGLMQRGLNRPLKRIVGPWRADRIKERLRVRQVMEGLFMQPGYPAIPSAVRHQLASLLAGEIQQVEALLGRNLSAWREPAEGRER